MKARAFLEAEKPGQRRVARTCALLEVSKAAYYQSLKAEPSTRARTDAELAKVIAQVHQVSDGTYGSPRVQAELAHQGIAVAGAGWPGSCAPPAWRAAASAAGARPLSPRGRRGQGPGPHQTPLRPLGGDGHPLRRRHHLLGPAHGYVQRGGLSRDIAGRGLAVTVAGSSCSCT